MAASATQVGPTLAAYDGATDFAGPSGLSQSISATTLETATHLDQSRTAHLSDTSALAAFTGTGTLALPISSLGQSAISSSVANLLTELTTAAGATVTVSYTYLPPPSRITATRVRPRSWARSTAIAQSGDRKGLCRHGCCRARHRAIWLSGRSRGRTRSKLKMKFPGALDPKASA